MQLGEKEFCKLLLFNTIGPKFQLFLNRFSLLRVKKFSLYFTLDFSAIMLDNFSIVALIDLLTVLLLEFGV